MALGGVLIRMALVLSCLCSLQTFAKEIEKIDFPEQLDLGAKKMVLNGAGLRLKRKFGMDFRVYVAGLYLTGKNSDAKAVIASDDPKIIRMVFLRSLDKDTLQEGMDEGFKKNCKKDCDAMKSQLKAFDDLLTSVKEKHELKMQFDKDSVSVELKGKESHSGKVEGANFSKTLLAVFIGDDPPTEDFKKGLLGK